VAIVKEKNEGDGEDFIPPNAADADAADNELTLPYDDDITVVDLHKHRAKTGHESRPPSSHVGAVMSDLPSRPEIAAQLQAAEARTELRIGELRNAMEFRANTTDHKIDLLIGQVQGLSAVVAEVKADSKLTRNTIIGVGAASFLAILALVVTLWIAGMNIQANMIAIFQAGLGVRALPQNAEVPKGPPIEAPQSPKPPKSQEGR
jgi:hypothetical protein